MSMMFRITSWLRAVVVALVVLAITGSCYPAGVATQTGTTPAVGQSGRSTPLPATQPLPRCDSPALILPASALASAEKVGMEQGISRSVERHHQQIDWLSLHIELDQEVFAYDSPIPFRLTISNETEHPVVFLRPRSISLDWVGIPSDLTIGLVSSSGEKIEPKTEDHIFLRPGEMPLLKRELFTVLPAEGACTVDLQLIWNHVWGPLEDPIPPGDYRMRVGFEGSHLGPEVEWEARSSGRYEEYDVGAWVGLAGPSNAVTFTILPPD